MLSDEELDRYARHLVLRFNDITYPMEGLIVHNALPRDLAQALGA